MAKQQNQMSEEQKAERVKLYDELNRMQIDQLHKATLNFSNQSHETKKLCMTVETGVFTLLATIYKDQPLSDWILILVFFGILIPLLFYVVDAGFWFYQNSLRKKMIVEENEIRARHQMRARSMPNNMAAVGRLRMLGKAFFNSSQAMYIGLIAAAALVGLFVRVGGKIHG